MNMIILNNNYDDLIDFAEFSRHIYVYTIGQRDKLIESTSVVVVRSCQVVLCVCVCRHRKMCDVNSL
jgi:hypothetical protein